MARKPPALLLPTSVRDEIVDVAARAQRSTAFVVHRALMAGRDAPPAEVPDAPRAPLALDLDEDDPPDLVKRLRSAAGGRVLDDAVAAAWLASRDKFLVWVARAEAAHAAERADELDAALADAAAPATPGARLDELAHSEYPRVRALVARHPNTPRDTVERLAADRDRAVRDAAAQR